MKYFTGQVWITVKAADSIDALQQLAIIGEAIQKLEGVDDFDMDMDLVAIDDATGEMTEDEE